MRGVRTFAFRLEDGSVSAPFHGLCPTYRKTPFDNIYEHRRHVTTVIDPNWLMEDAIIRDDLAGLEFAWFHGWDVTPAAAWAVDCGNLGALEFMASRRCLAQTARASNRALVRAAHDNREKIMRCVLCLTALSNVLLGEG